MKKNDTIIVAMICISSAFIINIIILLFLRNRALSTGAMSLLENSLVFLGLLLITMLITLWMRIKRWGSMSSYYKNLSDSILTNAENGFAVLDESNHFEVSSPRFKEMLNLNEVSMIGHSAAEVLPKSIYRFVMEYRLNVHSTDEEPLRQTLQFGDTFLYAAAFTVLDDQGHPRYVITLEDRTRQIVMEQQLIDQLEEVQFHMEAKESLLANVSHELKTPLNAIIGLSHILEDSDLNERQKEIVSKISVSSDFLLDLINNVLDFSKLKNGTISMESSHFRLKDLMDDLNNMFSPLTAQKDIRLLTNFQFDPELCLHLDRLRMEQILVNLINNACKFTDVGYIKVDVHVLKEFQDTITLKFSIEDTGIGIDYKDLSGIFNEFYQAEKHLTKIHQGTGLGLPICKQLVEHMGGSLWAESKKGMGSTFFFTITAPKYYSALEDKTPLIPVLHGQGEKILVVEDTQINYEVVEDLLSKVNLCCEHASSGLAALNMCEKAGNGYYKAILMDIHMPIMDGYEATRRLKEMGITAPIIALTATNMDEDTQKRYEDLFSDFILKPFKYTQLYSTLHPYIEDAPVSGFLPVSENPFAGRDQAIENLGGNPALYEKHLNRFKKNYAEACDTLENHLSSGQTEKAKILAHSIKGLAGTLGLTYLARSAEVLESAINSGSGNLSPQVTVFRDKLDQVING